VKCVTIVSTPIFFEGIPRQFWRQQILKDLDPNSPSKRVLKEQQKNTFAFSKVMTAETIAAKAICTYIAFFAIHMLSSFLQLTMLQFL